MNAQAAGLRNGRGGSHEGSGHQVYDHGTVTRSSGRIRRHISDESWIEVSSRPSTSSLSSTATDEVVTTGLTVAAGSNGRRRRQLHRSAPSRGEGRLSRRAAGSNESSQEEYEESESESDRVMISSNEDLQPGFSREEEQNDPSPPLDSASAKSDVASINSAEDDDDDDENATALGVADPTPFTPQPHAFSHPPSTRFAQRQASSQGSYFPPVSPSAGPPPQQTQTQSNNTAPSVTARAHTRTRSHTPYNIIAPNHSVSVDHDAALRASLSTLLSCAAAARGLQKRESTPASASAPSRALPPQRSRQSSRVEPGTLRIVPESALGKVEESPPALPQRPSPPSTDSPSSPVRAPPKRKAKSPARDRRKKHRSSMYVFSDDAVGVISPTFTTWVVGAGVLVLFSAISFSAGYVLGKEVGRVDAMGSGVGLGCGSEADSAIGKGIVRSRAWRWGNTSGVRA